jgi:hypothetical protein
MFQPLEPELAAYDEQFRENRAIAERLCAGLTTDQFNWRPAPDRWSVAECLVHLNLSARQFSARVDEAIDRARPAGLTGSGPFRYGLLSRLMLRAVSPGGTRRYKAPKQFAPPRTAHDVTDVLASFRKAGETWAACLRAACGLDLARVKVPSPAVPILRFPLGATFAIQAAHERRHLLQAERVLSASGFPK